MPAHQNIPEYKEQPYQRIQKQPYNYELAKTQQLIILSRLLAKQGSWLYSERLSPRSTEYDVLPVGKTKQLSIS